MDLEDLQVKGLYDPEGPGAADRLAEALHGGYLFALAGDVKLYRLVRA